MQGLSRQLSASASYPNARETSRLPREWTMGRQYQAFSEDAAAAVHSRWAVAITVSILALIALLPLALAIPNLVRSDDPLAVRIGVALGLLAFGLMALQIVIGSRLRLVSDPIGLGQLLGLHRLIVPVRRIQITTRSCSCRAPSDIVTLQGVLHG